MTTHPPDNRPKRIGGSNKTLTMREAADYLGVAYVTLRHNYRVWRIPFTPVGRRVQFRERDLEAWLERKRVS